MPKQFDLLIFDWDGTLMDSAGYIVNALQRASEDLGLPVPTDRESRQIIGLGLTQALETLHPDLDAARYPELVEAYRRHYLGNDHLIPLFDGVVEGIADLAARGFTLAVATGKSSVGLSRALEVSGLGPHFAATRCADQTHSKPHPAMVLELLDQLMFEPERALVIGDTSHDLLMASNADVARLAVSYGAHERADLEPHAPLAVLDSFAEVHAWLTTHG